MRILVLGGVYEGCFSVGGIGTPAISAGFKIGFFELGALSVIVCVQFGFKLPCTLLMVPGFSAGQLPFLNRQATD
jgi:hypothetical protein